MINPRTRFKIGATGERVSVLAKTDINCYDLGIIRFKRNIFSCNENYQASMIS